MRRLAHAILCAVLALAGGLAQAQLSLTDRRAAVSNTKHNLSTTGPGTPGTTKSAESQICAFCHTPHGATTADLGGVSGTVIQPPLWNRKLSTASYTKYTSESLDADVLQGGALDAPAGTSKLCLSCHDGTIALGNVNVLNGQGNPNTPGTVTVSDLNVTMPEGSEGGATGGFTRNLGTNLKNDHPISLTFSQALANRDGDLRAVDTNQRYPASNSIVGPRASGANKPLLPMDKTGADNAGQVQCGTCHDPHLWSDPNQTLTTSLPALYGNQKFLRMNRFQRAQPVPSGSGTASAYTTDIICLGCHDKGYSWAYSAHAHNVVADEAYLATPGTRREFPSGLRVWQASCLNCHDTHTVQGAERLLREGTNSTSTPKQGGSPATEETCYQCHVTAGSGAIATGSGTVPDLKTEFGRAVRMPIAKDTETHNISAKTGSFNVYGTPTSTTIDCSGTTSTAQCGRDGLEPRATLGHGTLSNRHVECTDCHNPHRVIRSQNGLPGGLTEANTSTDSRASHNHAAGHTNVISGALRGAYGVEPRYGSSAFFSLPSSYDIKRGDPGTSSSTASTEHFVTREYQICLKCHSDFAYADDGVYPSSTGNRPNLGYTDGTASGMPAGGGTAANPDGRTNFTTYTNQAMEFQPNNASGATGAGTAYQTNNFRSWHPVIGATGRPLSSRGAANTSTWLSPWNATANVGSQTMYCSDCHGNVVSGATVDPGSAPWGPHGSSNKFILKGDWGPGLGGPGRDTLGSTDTLCFKCHNRATYTTRSDSGNSGFCCDGRGNLHNYHVDMIGRIYCTWCHVAVPHGWKNKALLVNLNDVGPEAGFTVAQSKEVSINGNADNYSNGPYYARAKNKIVNFKASGNWLLGDCGSSNKAAGNRINASNGNSTNRGTTGDSWMTNACSNPP